ncbi:hypothetical protein PIB30_051857 [Stylosanthes scabra]|uniref:Uncharacterized protein n=1 Tax=Stylosanthes scabra TaxID=79078 RepID=A0ABU6RI18_9FABA|nr:hypothetical protein [Stylosanthes scabra]
MIKENSNGLILAEKALKEKDALYEKHLTNASSTLEELSKDKEAVLKKKSKMQNEEDLKRLQEEEIQEIDLFKSFEENKLQLKDTLEEFLKELEH